ncbi:MAG TPA: FAD binding domain-containing protein [Acetobacteraceae bacterium]|jgi:carbon-monoxide dehydrogenase medium subunit
MLVALRSRRQIAPFTLHQPVTLAEAVALRQPPGTSAFLAGGIDVIDWLKHGNPIDRVIRLDGVPGLAEIAGGPDQLRIGALATHAAIADSALVRGTLPDLAALWHNVANPRVRFAGTIGGNVMAGNADYDGLPALLALGAGAEVATEAGIERIAPDRLAPSGPNLVTGFVIPDPATRRLFADRSLRPALVVWLGFTLVAGRVTVLRLAVGMAHSAPVCIARVLNMPQAELGREAADIAAALTHALPEPVSDGRASAAYRRRMVGVLTRRILIRAGGSA